MNGLRNGLQEGLISGLNNGLAEGLTNGLTNGLFVNEYPFDIDANKFLLAANINDIRIKNAINKLVINLKAANIWTKMKAIYPMVGGTATTHKFNLKNPADTNAAFRLNFGGGWTHSANGALPNGTNAYASSYVFPNISLSLNSTHISSYIRNTSQGVLLGVDSRFTTPLARLWIAPNFNASSRYVEINTNSATALTPISNNIGLWLGSRTASNVSKLYNNNNVNHTSTALSSILDSAEITLAARNTGALDFYSSSQIAFASIGDGLSDAEALALYNATQTFNTTLGRQV